MESAEFPTLPATRRRLSSFGRITIAKFNVIVPRYFDATSQTEPLLARFKRYTREQIILLRDAGLVECVNPARNLWKCTHRANVLTRRCEERTGGCVSLEVPASITNSIAAHMADHPQQKKVKKIWRNHSGERSSELLTGGAAA